MVNRTKRVTGTAADNVVTAVKNNLAALKKAADTQWPIEEVYVNPSTGAVVVAWQDQSSETAKVEALTQKALSLKTALASATDDVTKATLYYELGQVAAEYKKLTGVDLKTVIG